MKRSHLTSIMQGLDELGLSNARGVSWNLTPAELVMEAIRNGEGVLADNGALMWDTGKFTGRAPKDRYIVEDDITRDKVWWGDINKVFPAEAFDRLYNKMIKRLNGQ
ncbi:MAG: phosphoenolpyruvate carboxykinase (ATP), partial [Bacteroidota bacterium]